VVSNPTGDRDYDDETQITVDFSKIYSIVYGSRHKEMGVREFYGPLRITITGLLRIQT